LTELFFLLFAHNGKNSLAAGEEPKQLVPPTFAKDLDPNVRAGFNSTCDYIRQSHAALTAQIAQLATRIDAMGDATARATPPAAQPRDVVQRRPVEYYGHRPVEPAYDGELEDDTDYAPQQRPFVARPVSAHRVQPHDRDRVGHVGRVPLDEWEMRMDQIFAIRYYTEEKRL
jgi:hypothetical protein